MGRRVGWGDWVGRLQWRRWSLFGAWEGWQLHKLKQHAIVLSTSGFKFLSFGCEPKPGGYLSSHSQALCLLARSLATVQMEEKIAAGGCGMGVGRRLGFAGRSRLLGKENASAWTGCTSKRGLWTARKRGRLVATEMGRQRLRGSTNFVLNGKPILCPYGCNLGHCAAWPW